MTFSSPTPDLSFPTPFEGAFTLTMSATNSHGASPDVPVTLMCDPVFADDAGAGKLAATGSDASVLLAAAMATIVCGALMLDNRRRRASRTRVRPSRP